LTVRSPSVALKISRRSLLKAMHAVGTSRPVSSTLTTSIAILRALDVPALRLQLLQHRSDRGARGSAHAARNVLRGWAGLAGRGAAVMQLLQALFDARISMPAGASARPSC
jgi:hypothetical protein